MRNGPRISSNPMLSHAIKQVFSFDLEIKEVLVTFVQSSWLTFHVGGFSLTFYEESKKCGSEQIITLYI